MKNKYVYGVGLSLIPFLLLLNNNPDISHKTEHMFGDVTYRNSDNELHRKNGPAVIYNDGTKMWFRDGKLHNESGPAVVFADGREEYWINGVISEIVVD